VVRPEVTGRKLRVTAARAKRRVPAHEAHDDEIAAAAATEASGEQDCADQVGERETNDESGEQEPTPHREPAPHAQDRLPPIRGPPAVYSIADFCRAHRISVSMYFKMRSQGLGPREMAVGSRRLISQEAAAEWRKAREAAA
jgi:hypothetical protein